MAAQSQSAPSKRRQVSARALPVGDNGDPWYKTGSRLEGITIPYQMLARHCHWAHGNMKPKVDGLHDFYRFYV